MKRVLLLGSTGSIGRNALDVLRDLRNSHQVVGLSCHSNPQLLLEQALEFEPLACGATDPAGSALLKRELTGRAFPERIDGNDLLTELIARTDPDIVFVAVSGAAGLLPSLETVKRGKRLALANKESLVMAGHLFRRALSGQGSEIVPVDSEHSAVFQALRGENRASVRRVYLTASGGPFVDATSEKIRLATPREALSHPTWNMGKKITIDSATMMNKALEIIEARWLFDLPVEKIDVVIHRQSIVHGMAEFEDGSIIAQMGLPDMRVPIRFALTYPERGPSRNRYFDVKAWSKLTFEEPDPGRFPALALGFRAAGEAGLAGAVLNAANEVAVDLFLKGAIRFDAITRMTGEVLDKVENKNDPSLEEVLDADRWAREETLRCSSH